MSGHSEVRESGDGVNGDAPQTAERQQHKDGLPELGSFAGGTAVVPQCGGGGIAGGCVGVAIGATDKDLDSGTEKESSADGSSAIGNVTP